MANEQQIERWNGPAAARWLAERSRHAGVRRRLVPYLLRGARVRPGDRILDVGCGCGETTAVLARIAGPTGEVVGLDMSGPLLAVAREQTDVRLLRADAQTVMLPANHFDTVVSSFGVMFFDDPVAAFRNLRAGLRPGGRLAFLCWQDALRNEVFALPLRALRQHGWLPEGAGGDPFADRRWVVRMLIGAGFTAVRVRALHEPARLGSDVPDVMAYALATTQVRNLLAAVPDPVVVERILATMAEQFAAHQNADGIWGEAAGYLITARAPRPSS